MEAAVPKLWYEQTDKAIADHEARLRAVERRGYMAIGAAAAIGSLLGSGLIITLLTWIGT